MANQLLFRVFAISLLIMVSGSISIGSDSESLLTCSKFHFEEKVLEKLVRLEHKMEKNEEKMKRWEDTFFSKLEKMDIAIKETEIFVESVRDTNLQEQSRLNDSYQEIVENLKIRSKNETELYREQIKAMLESLSSKIEKKERSWDDTFLSRLTKMDQVTNQTETFVESMLRTHLQDQSRLNVSYQEIVENVNLRSTNVTKIYGEQMNAMLEYMSSKIEEFSVAEKKRGNALELMQYTLQQEQKRFNQSFDLILENTKLSSNKTIQELFAHQQKVAVTACVSSGPKFPDSVVRFSTVHFHVGIDNLDRFKSSGKFVCEIPGLYYISAYIRSSTKSHSFEVRKNGNTIVYSASSPDASTYPISAVVELQLKDTLYVHAPSLSIHSTYSCLSIMKVG